MDDDAVSQMIELLTVPYGLIKGKSIREVAAILSTVDLLIANDTGIMHVAGAVGIPILSLFGPTDPKQWAPIGKTNRWLRGETETSIRSRSMKYSRAREKCSKRSRQLSLGEIINLL